MYIVRCFYLPFHILKLIYDSFINNFTVVEICIYMCVHAVIYTYAHEEMFFHAYAD